jgi:hypothetical protein
MTFLDEDTVKAAPRYGCYLAGGVLLALAAMPFSSTLIKKPPNIELFAAAKATLVSLEVAAPAGVGLTLVMLGGCFHARQRLMDRRAKRRSVATPSA